MILFFRCMQGLNKRNVNDLIIDILKIRDTNNKRGNRQAFKKLSVNAKLALQKKRYSITYP